MNRAGTPFPCHIFILRQSGRVKTATVYQMRFFSWILVVGALSLGVPVLRVSLMDSTVPESRLTGFYTQAMARYDAGDFKRASAMFHTLADYGSTGAQTMLGHLYWEGYGVPRSHARAVAWFHHAAERGYAPAQVALGKAYLSGHRHAGLDSVSVAMWLMLAHDRGTGAIKAEAQRVFKQVEAKMSANERFAAENARRAWRPALVPASY